MFSRDFSPPTLLRNFEQWVETYRSVTAMRFSPQREGDGDFAGWAGGFAGFGFHASDMGFNIVGQNERTRRDVRIDARDCFCALIQVAGSATVRQNGQIVPLAPGSVILRDATRPSVVRWEGDAHWFGLNLPRQALVSQLGFEPASGRLARGGPRAGRLLHEIALSALQGEDVSSSTADVYIQLAVYDVIGALFADEVWPALRATDELFKRLLRIIDHNFTDPNFGPPELADEAGISLRYVHKLFGVRGNTCNAYISTRRLNHAAQLLRRRSALGTKQPLGEIAHACGFSSQTVFTRKFHRHFKSTPSDYT